MGAAKPPGANRTVALKTTMPVVIFYTTAMIDRDGRPLFPDDVYRLDAALLLHPVMAAIWTWIFIRSIWLTGIRRKVIWRGRTYDARQTRFGAERR